jgi:hypothetical protein
MRDCRPIPGGFICGGRAPRVKCTVPSCQNWATLECDYPVSRRKSGTCDHRLCERCTTKDGDKDHCPPHAALVLAKAAEPAEPAPPPPPAPTCVECGATSKLVKGGEIYPRWNPRARGGVEPWFWRCVDCGAYVGCHAGTQRALGRPGGPTTRTARIAAHAEFDRLCKAKAKRDGCSKNEARGAGYRWLTTQMGRDQQVHIAEMSAAEAHQVVDLCRGIGRK